MKNLIESKISEFIGQNCVFLCYEFVDKGVHVKLEALENDCFTSSAVIKKGSDFRVVIFGIRENDETNFEDERGEFTVNFKEDGTLKFNDNIFLDSSYHVARKGDVIQIIHNEDDDLNLWEEEQDTCNFKVELFCNESELVWVENCPYAIPMANVLKNSI